MFYLPQIAPPYLHAGMSRKTCIVIMGPTAVGKTALSIEAAVQLQTAILSADSRQCYRELGIGVAKPSPAQLHTVPHYFINSHSIHDPVHAAAFEQYALAAVQYTFSHSDTAVVVGGTGLYIQAFCQGMDEVPVVTPGIRRMIREEYTRQGIQWLQEQIRSSDPVYYESGELQNPHRMMRALEVFLSTGRSIRSFQKGQTPARGFDIIKIGLELPRETLHAQIHQRVDGMIREGLVEEVRALMPYRHLQPLQTIGYQEIIALLGNQLSLPEAVDQIKAHTRQYAKRQMTWFKKDPAVVWFSPYEPEKVLTYIFRTLYPQ